MTEETEKPLSLQERRLLNIQRNQSFLSTLLAAEKALESAPTGPVAAGDEDGSTITSLRGSNTIVGEDDLDEQVVRFKCRDDLLAVFPFRSQQVHLLYRYLGRFDRIHYDPVPRPPLLLHGGVGTGKTSLVRNILVSEELLYIKIDCAYFHTLKPLFASLQYEMSVLLQSKLSAKRKRSSSKHHSIQQFFSLPCSTFLELTTFITNVFSSVIANEINLIIVLDNLHAVVDYQDDHAITTLLSLQEICPANISLIYIVQSMTVFHRASHRTNTLLERCLQVYFSPYTEPQARQILLKIFQQRLDHIDRLQEETEAETGKDVALEEAKKAIKQELSDHFVFITEHSISLIFVYNHHLRDILCFLLSIWQVWYQRSVCHMYEDFVESSRTSFTQTLRSSRSPISSKTTAHMALVKPSISTIRGILELLLQRNTMNVSVQDVVAIRKSLNLEDATAASKGDRLKKKSIAKDSFAVNTSMMPQRLKCLLVACFLASHNPKGSDNLTFIGEKAKKRKVQETTGGNSKESLEASMTNTNNSQNTSQSAKTQSSNRYFSLERLLSIYAQVLRLSSDGMDASYGSASLQTLLMTLVNRKLVSLSPYWKPSKPLYGSNISRALVDDVARSLRFSVNDFLVQHYKLAI